MSFIVNKVNQLTAIYEHNMGTRFVLIDNNDLLLFNNSDTDGLIDEPDPVDSIRGNRDSVQTLVDQLIGFDNYDIAHFFYVSGEGGGGGAEGKVCSDEKTFGGTTSPIYTSVLAHEIGHQFGLPHTWAYCEGLGAGSSAFGVEPGSGSTIMGYAGVCGATNIWPRDTVLRFHPRSQDEFKSRNVDGDLSSCGLVVNTDNTVPVANGGADFVIPIDTPFTLNGSATDADGDTITYAWDEYDTVASPQPPGSDVAPFFMSYLEEAHGSRTFPRMEALVNGTQEIGEYLPLSAQTLTFRLTANDNRASGSGVAYDEIQVQTITQTAVLAPVTKFEVTSQMTDTTWTAGATETITWNVGNSDQAPINCSLVDIDFAADGFDYSHNLANNTNNDGTEDITVPNGIATQQGRVRVSCVSHPNHTFFNINSGNITLGLASYTDCAAGVVSSLANAGTCTLREAVANAAANDTITFDPRIAGATIALTEVITINQALTIDGTGQAITVDGGGTTSLLRVTDSGVTLREFTLANGAANSGSAISVSDFKALTLDRMIIRDNKDADRLQGVVNGYGLTVNITDTTFLNNSGGSALLVYDGTINLYRSTFSGNTGQLSLGGAVALLGRGTLNVYNSTFTENHAYRGGAIGVRTMSSWADTASITVTLVNNTIYGNTSSGGIDQLSAEQGKATQTITFHLTNNIIGGSKTVDCGWNGSATIATNRHNLIEDGTCSVGATNNLSGEAQVRPLANNGGATQTMAIPSTSPAVDNGDTAACATLEINDEDQRGVSRDATCDMGAYEFSGIDAYIELTASADFVEPGDPITFTLDYGNGGTAQATNVTIALPLNTTYLSNLSWQSSGHPVTYSSGTYQWTADPLNPGDSGQIVVTASTNTAAVFQTTATITGDNDADAGNNSETAVVVSRSNNCSLIVSSTGSSRDGDYTDGNNTLQEALACATAGDTVTFSATLAGMTIAVPAELDIPSGVTVDGGVHNITLDGNNANRIFRLTESDATLTNLTIANGNADHGGAIWVDSSASLTVNNVIFNDSTASAWGGAIRADGATAVKNSSFSNNSADFGGAIFANAPVAVNNSGFTTNTATFGGAISNRSSLSVSDSTFNTNQATNDGGAIESFGFTASVTNTTFTDNVASNHGGAIAAFSAASITVNGGMFDSNDATNFGGAIYVHSAGTILGTTSTNFQNNTASRGGAIAGDTEAAITVNGGTFSGNNVSSFGGAIYLQVTGTTLELTKVDFQNNTASNGGAIATLTGPSVTITDSTFTSNTVPSSEGGAIRHDSNTPLNVTNSTFHNNSATMGGAIHNNNGQLTVSGSTFTSNTANWGGGAIASRDAATTQLTITQSALVNNNAGGGGGGAIFTEQTTHIENSTFDNNTTSSTGGAVRGFGASSALTVAHVTAVNNSASQGGGVDVAATLNAQANIFYDNSSNDCNLNGGSVTSNGDNIIGNAGNCAGFSSDSTANPLLGPLTSANQRRPLPASPALSAVASCSLSEDQIGTARSGACDVGAAEVTYDTVLLTNASGGSGSITQGAYTLDVNGPVGIVSTDTTLHIDLTTHPVGSVSGLLTLDFGLNIIAEQGGSVVNNLVFAQPLQLTLTYLDAAVGDGDEALLDIYRFDGSAWVNGGIAITNRDAANDEIAFTVDQTAEFGAFAPPENMAPDAVDDTAMTDAETAVFINVLANDTDPENASLTITAWSTPANGTVAQNGMQLLYTPDAGFIGNDTFTYTISDGTRSDTATVNVTVNFVSVCTITTFAGMGTPGYSGDAGLATAAMLNYPSHIAVDAAGNLYIADTHNHRIRKVDSAGNITTIAGDGTSGFSGDGGPATSAQLSYPHGIAVDSAGNLYIADFGNNRVRKINTTGTISTFAGDGTYGDSGDGGPATAAQFHDPFNVAVDSNDNVYIADYRNSSIRMVNSSGIISTVAGGGYGDSGDGGLAVNAKFHSPRGIAIAADGTLYIADTHNNRIRVVDGAGTVTTFAGSGTLGDSGYGGDGGLATNAQLSFPAAVALDGDGNLYIADYANSRIRMVDSAGAVSTLAGNGIFGYGGDGGSATAAQLNYPRGIAVGSNGNLYIADTHNHRIRRVLCTTNDNTAPTAADDSYTTEENTTLTVAATGVLSNDMDSEGNPLTAILVDDVSSGTLNLNSDGGFVYTPTVDFFGIVTFTYQANDGALPSNTAAVTITVTEGVLMPDLFVDAEAIGGGTGLSWADAFTNLQDALAAASSGNTIFVAEGVYYPDVGGGQTNNDPNASFNIPAGVALYGGFAPGSGVTELAQRDWMQYLTILSGDIDGNDFTNANGVVSGVGKIVGDNSVHVVNLDGSSTPITGATRLDGFIITAGQADAAAPNGSGGGLMCNGRSGGQCNPTLANLTFSGNWAQHNGGAMINDGLNGDSSPTLTHVYFVGNQAAGNGGALYNDGGASGNGSPMLLNVSFNGNSAGNKGGGLYNEGQNGGNSSPTLVNVVFSGNAAVNGGALVNDGSSGGTTTPTLINVTFNGNRADEDGGAILNDGSGGGNSTATLQNGILWNNAAQNGESIFNIFASVNISYSLVQGAYSTIAYVGTGSVNYDGATNVIADPTFTQPAYPLLAPTSCGDLRLEAGSPAIDAGFNTAVPDTVTTDLDGSNRIINSTVDMGAYEHGGTPSSGTACSEVPIAVNDNATTFENTAVTINVLANDGDPNGNSLMLTAVGTPGSGATALSGTQVVYTPAIDFLGPDTFTYTISDGTHIVSALVDVTVVISPTTDPVWQPGFGIPGTNNAIFDMVYNENNGEIIIAGQFTAVGEAVADRLARWDGTQWLEFGGGISGSVYALAMAPNGDLYIGGAFNQAGGVAAVNIARWNGVTWSALGGGVNNRVEELAFDSNGDLIAAGSFTIAGGATANRVARWNPSSSSWSALGSGVDNSVQALAIDLSNNDVYIGGTFTTAGGGAANRIAHWDGSSWNAMGSGMDREVNVLVFDRNRTLYAGGFFSTAGGNAAPAVAKWSGGSWSSVGTLGAARVYDLVLDDSGNIYAGANDRFSKWDGSSWNIIGGNIEGNANAIVIDNNDDFFVAGFFLLAGNDKVTASNIVKWDGTNYTPLWSGVGNRIRTVAIDNDGNIYAGGQKLPTASVSQVYRWTEAGWESIGQIGGSVNALTTDASGNLYAGGDFVSIDGVALSGKGIAKWDPNSGTWSVVGGGLYTGWVNGIAIANNGDMYIGGNFDRIGAVTGFSHLAKWDGSTWSQIGAADGFVNDLRFANNGDLYIAGNFNTIDSVPARGLAWRNGATWSDVGGSLNQAANALAFDSMDNLYVGGAFTQAGAVSVSRLAKWDGSAWNDIGGTNNTIFDLDVGENDVLYIGGQFTSVGGQSALYLAQFNGSIWSSLGNGLNALVAAVEARGRLLVAGGDFSITGNIASGYVGLFGTQFKPIVGDDEAYTLVDQPVTIDVLSNDSDLDNDPLMVTSVSQPLNGSVGINGTQVVYTPTTGFSGSDTFSYTVSDDTDSVTGHVTVIVAADTAQVTPGATGQLSVGNINDGQINVTIGADSLPPGSPQTTLTLFKQEAASPALGDFKFGGIAFQINAFQNGVLQENFSFNSGHPLEVSLMYTDADISGADEALLGLYYFDEVTGSWKTDGITIVSRDTANNTIVVTIAHLTEFALFEFTGTEAVAPVISLSRQGAANGLLSWVNNPANCSYEVYESSSPYFFPTGLPQASVQAPTETHLLFDIFGDVNNSHFYVVQALNCGSHTAISNTVGEFEFSIVPGG